MTEPLPELNVPTGASRFNDPPGNGFAKWFGDIKQGVDVQGMEVLNRAKTLAVATASSTVEEQIEELGLLPGARPSSSVAFAITDAQGRRSWVEIDLQGHPTPHASQMITEAIAAPLQASGLLPLPVNIPAGSGFSYVLTDAAGRKSEFQLDLNGRFTGPFPERIIAAALEAVGGAGAALLPIAAWGDSMTEYGWPSHAAAELGVTFRNYGVGGQLAGNIAARQGGSPAFLTFPSNTIPASGNTSVTSTAAPYTSATGTGTSSGLGSVNGIPGTLSRNNVSGAHTFTRTTPGPALWTPPGTPWIPDNAVLNKGQMAVFWVGRNNYENSAEIIRHIRAMVDYLTPTNKRFLVLEIPPWDTEILGTPSRATLDATNAAIRQAFPYEFTAVSSYLRGPAMSDLGLTPTAQDLTDMSNGVTPSSLRLDGGHPNTNGSKAIGKYVARTITAQEWIK